MKQVRAKLWELKDFKVREVDIARSTESSVWIVGEEGRRLRRSSRGGYYMHREDAISKALHLLDEELQSAKQRLADAQAARYAFIEKYLNNDDDYFDEFGLKY